MEQQLKQDASDVIKTISDAKSGDVPAIVNDAVRLTVDVVETSSLCCGMWSKTTQKKSSPIVGVA